MKADLLSPLASAITRALLKITLIAAVCVVLWFIAWVLDRASIHVALFTYGFFTVHSVASGWVGALAPASRGEASGMYLACYYLGSSIIGYLSGHVMHAFGWWGLVGAILLEQNDEWAVQRSRYMTLETISQISDDPFVSLPAVAR